MIQIQMNAFQMSQLSLHSQVHNMVGTSISCCDKFSQHMLKFICSIKRTMIFFNTIKLFSCIKKLITLLVFLVTACGGLQSEV